MGAKSGYCNGSDMLLFVGGKAVGSCTTHTTTFNSETKDRAVKPPASAGVSTGLWKNKGVVGLSVSISAEGLVFYDETETGFKELFNMWKTGKSVEVKCLERENSAQPYLAGKFVISSLERTDPAQDDSTYSISLENDGMPTTMDETKITDNVE
ncbi:phage tail tube protein [Porphyromonas cangingivalis]|uniref:Predicted secreted protein n=1 Tax=Porphyromonas cangingivalis TaxID=36874 RepID=A0A1T4KKR4_PORCN|nr:phage tail tube protein [Porphyromonas cangingivalis]SJZ42957.1 Predicted secreted protein [Porphyromonas cangingivalis]VEJ02593.1 Phage major tail protein 2 [Porphyromonas cangingivalis]